MTDSQVIFLKNNSIQAQGLTNICLWLLGARIGNTIIKMVEPKSFFRKIETMHGFVSLLDLNWVNSFCAILLGRNYSQPVVLEAAKSANVSIKVGVGANDIVDNNYNVEIKKMASWPSEQPTRIYVDSLVNGKEFHYYICKKGKQGRFMKNNSEIEIPFSAIIPYEMEFLGLKAEKEVVNWEGVKGSFNKNLKSEVA